MAAMAKHTVWQFKFLSKMATSCCRHFGTRWGSAHSKDLKHQTCVRQSKKLFAVVVDSLNQMRMVTSMRRMEWRMTSLTITTKRRENDETDDYDEMAENDGSKIKEGEW